MLAKKSIVYLFSVLMILGALFILSTSAFKLFEHHLARQKFQETTGTIYEISTNVVPNLNTGISKTRHAAHYRYEVEGVEYGGTLRYVSTMRVGDKVPILYHSEVHLMSFSVEQYRDNITPLFFIMGGILMVAGVMLLRRAKEL